MKKNYKYSSGRDCHIELDADGKLVIIAGTDKVRIGPVTLGFLKDFLRDGSDDTKQS